MFLLNQLVVYILPTVMSCVTGNPTMDLFYLLKENFKSLLYNSLITVKHFDKFSYLSRIRLHISGSIESNLAYTKVSVVVSQYMGSLWYPLTSSMHTNRQTISVVVSEIMPAFSLWCKTWCCQKSYQIHNQRIIREVWEESLYCLPY